jgi:hypothetical protein
VQIRTILIALLIACLSHCKSVHQPSSESEIEGFSGIKSSLWNSDLRVFSPDDMTATELSKYIRVVLRSKNLNYSEKYSAQLASDIIGVAHLMKLDPVIFAGLVAHESRYDFRAVNRNSRGVIGGSGLTQMTSIAVEEVNDQWDEEGKGKAVAYSSAVHEGMMKALDAPLLKGRVRMMKKSKDFLGKAEAALFYGAVMLKIMLTSVQGSKAAMKRCAIDKDRALKNSPLGYYRAALACYNGHPVNRLYYADKVFRDIANIVSIKVRTKRPSALPEPVEIEEHVDKTADQCWTIQLHATINEPNFDEVRSSIGKAGKLARLFDYPSDLGGGLGMGHLISLGLFETLDAAQARLERMLKLEPDSTVLKDAWIRLHDVEYTGEGAAEKELPNLCNCTTCQVKKD